MKLQEAIKEANKALGILHQTSKKQMIGGSIEAQVQPTTHAATICGKIRMEWIEVDCIEIVIISSYWLGINIFWLWVATLIQEGKAEAIDHDKWILNGYQKFKLKGFELPVVVWHCNAMNYGSFVAMRSSSKKYSDACKRSIENMGQMKLLNNCYFVDKSLKDESLAGWPEHTIHFKTEEDFFRNALKLKVPDPKRRSL